MSLYEPFHVEDSLTFKQAKARIRQLNGILRTDKSTGTRHVHYSATATAWITYEVSPTMADRFVLKFYKVCPCGGA